MEKCDNKEVNIYEIICKSEIYEMLNRKQKDINTMT